MVSKWGAGAIGAGAGLLPGAIAFGQSKGAFDPTLKQYHKYDPQTLQYIQSLMGKARPGTEGGIDFLSQMAQGKPEFFEQMEAPAMRQFSALQGQLGSRFSGMGTGARRSSGFGLATSGAGQQLAEQLQSQRMGYQQQAIRDLFGMTQDLLGRQEVENVESESPWMALLKAIGNIGGKVATAKLGGGG